MIFHPRASEERLEGFFQAFRHSLDIALLWFRSGERSNDERERERAMAGLSLQCAACKAQFRSVEEAQEHAELTKHADFQESTEPVRVCYCCCVFFPSCFLMAILVTDLLS